MIVISVVVLLGINENFYISLKISMLFITNFVVVSSGMFCRQSKCSALQLHRWKSGERTRKTFTKAGCRCTTVCRPRTYEPGRPSFHIWPHLHNSHRVLTNIRKRRDIKGANSFWLTNNGILLLAIHSRSHIP